MQTDFAQSRLPSKFLFDIGKGEQAIFLHENKFITREFFLSQVALLSEKLIEGEIHRTIIFCENTLLFAIAFFASLAASKEIILPQNIQTNSLQKIAQANDLLLSDSPIQVSSLNNLQVSLTKNLQSNICTNNSSINLKEAQITFFTSGSSGEAKAVPKTLANLENEILELEKLWGNELQESIFLSSVSHQHIYGLLFRLLWPLSRGNIICSFNLLAQEELFALCNEFAKSVFISSPAFLKRLEQNESIKFENIRCVFSSGGLLNEKVSKSTLQILGVSPIEVLGSTETGGVAHRQQNKTQLWTNFPNVKTKIKAETHELMVQSGHITERAYIPTGDCAELVDEKQFKLLGRVDSIVKVEEKRISLKEIENRLLEHHFVNDCKAILIETHRQAIATLIELKAEGQEYLLKAGNKKLNLLFREHLLQYIDLIALPRKWRYVDQMPYNSSGKLLQTEIENLFTEKQPKS